MRFLRRSDQNTAAGSSDASEQAQDTGPASDGSRTPGKGRPTPKRREAETRRRGPAPPPPRTQREAARYARANRPDKHERRRLAAERRARMDAGDDRVLLPRDRGPVKAHIRDLVDSRPHLMGLFMPLALVVLISVLLPIPSAQQYLSLFSLIVLLSMIIEGVLLGRRITRKVRAKFPDEAVSGLGTGWYAFTRASQLRKLRVPKPRVQRGANP
ncbi:DUF3043 domain-containing protein [Pseudonocardia asaccharolytica]|uniref:DUF3043 domain-containing protein n=1 Tax=Pseudonocardia asaccharolytica TaxID=54010 RepID=UPI000408027D|nr:DUF3043 domain-containing protein [Pseudonocardia asaccharolytica]